MGPISLTVLYVLYFSVSTFSRVSTTFCLFFCQYLLCLNLYSELRQFNLEFHPEIRVLQIGLIESYIGVVTECYCADAPERLV